MFGLAIGDRKKAGGGLHRENPVSANFLADMKSGLVGLTRLLVKIVLLSITQMEGSAG